MKIVFVNLYSGAVERGAESFVHELAHQLEREHQVLFLKGHSETISTHQFPSSWWRRWFNRKRFFVDDAGIAILKFSLSQLPTIIKQKPDWVVPLNGFWQVLLLKLIQPFVGYRILITGHSGPGWDERWNLYLKPDVFVATTEPTGVWARESCPYTRVEVIPYGIEVSSATPISKLPGKLKSPLVLCPAALVPYKRVETAIRAVAQLPNVNLLVLGKGPLEQELQQRGHQLLGDRFHLTAVPTANMPRFYQAVNLVTLPSQPQENSPMVFLEALAAGRLVVATDSPRNRWLLGNSGIFIDPEDIDSYANAIKIALKTKKPDVEPDLEKFLWPTVLTQYRYILDNKTHDN